jgi:hypothetical protein
LFSNSYEILFSTPIRESIVVAVLYLMITMEGDERLVWAEILALIAHISVHNLSIDVNLENVLGPDRAQSRVTADMLSNSHDETCSRTGAGNTAERQFVNAQRSCYDLLIYST